MKNTTLNNSNHQPKQFRKESMEFGLSNTSDKLYEMAALFSVIQELLEKDDSKHQIEKLARLGQFSCENWADTVDYMKDNLISESSIYFY